MNYEIMKESERGLQQKFLKFCNHVYETWQFVNKIIKSKTPSKNDMNQVLEMEEMSNHFEAQIQDDGIWSISKNEPLANHLRYVIAVIKSSNDLERMADYAVSAVKFFVNNKVIDSIRTLSLNILKSALLTMNKVFISMKTNPAIDTYKICEVAHKNFRKEYISNLKTLSSILKKSTVDEISNLFQGAIVIIKHIERLVDHLSNICENFVFIKQSDFFFDKHSKQLDK